jgi:proliferating cell nuclear antigen
MAENKSKKVTHKVINADNKNMDTDKKSSQDLMNDVTESASIFELQTVQTNAFKTLFEALKEILTDANIEVDETGLKISATDPTHTILVHLKLYSKNFEHYISKHKMTLGISMLCLFKLIKTMSNNDTLSLFVEKNDENHLGIIIENDEKKMTTKYKLNLMDLDEENIKIGDQDFSSIIIMPAVDFQKICRDASNISDTLEIRSVGQQLSFSCHGDFATQETILGGESFDGQGIKFEKSDNDVVQGYYNLKYLVLFTKCTNLCNNIKIYMKNNFPIIIDFTVGSLGDLKLALAPLSPDAFLKG